MSETEEVDAGKPGFRPTGMAGQIAALDVGETWSRALRFDPDVVPRADMAAAVDRLKGTVEPQVRRVRHATGRTFTIETFDARTASWHTVVGVVVTRLS